MSTAHEAAYRLVQKAELANEPITQLELHKLVYAAHGWHLGILGEPLFDDRIEAWDYGPVVPSLRHSLRAFGADHITTTAWANAGLPTGNPDPRSLGIIDETWNAYHDLSPASLVALTHADKTPWSKAYKRGVMGREIPREYIVEHYKRKRANPELIGGL